MSQESEVDAMLQNFKEAKASRSDTDALSVLQGEVDRLCDENSTVYENIDRSQLHCVVARWNGRNGYCKYDSHPGPQRRYNKKMTGTRSKTGHYIIGVNEKILEDGNRDGFIDTARHEVAHALAAEMYEKYPSRKRHFDYDPYFSGHGQAWKELASRLGSDPKSCHSKRDRSKEYRYYICCPNCGMENGKTKRSKVIKQPFTRKCMKCGQHPLSSYEAGQEPPEEAGVVAVDSIPWNDRDEWVRAGRP